MFPGAARFKVKPLMAPRYCAVEACGQGGHSFPTGHRDTVSNGGQEVQFGRVWGGKTDGHDGVGDGRCVRGVVGGTDSQSVSQSAAAAAPGLTLHPG